MHGGLTFISSSVANQLLQAMQAGEDADKSLKFIMFRFVVTLARQIGYHFART